MNVSSCLVESCCTKNGAMKRLFRDSVTITISSSSRSMFLDSACPAAGSTDRVKPFEDIPGPKPLPFIGNMFRYLPIIGEYSPIKFHEAQMKKYLTYGPIVKEHIVPGYCVVHLFDQRDIETLFRNETKHPRRDFFVGIGEVRKRNPEFKTVGLAPGNGEEWYKYRCPIQKALMNPRFIQGYYPQVNVVADSLIERIKRMKDDNHHVPRLMDEIFKWSVDSIMYVMFGRTKGSMKETISESPFLEEYVRNINNFFKYSGQIEASALRLWKKMPWLSPTYTKLEKAHNTAYEDIKLVANEILCEMLKQPETSDENECRPIVEKWLKDYSLEESILLSNDTIGAAVDTTSVSIANFLKNIAENPDVQEKLHEEIDNVLPLGEPVTAEKVRKMPYLRACLKESLRITPTAGGTFRTLEKDLVFSGYRVPKDTKVSINFHVTSVLEQNFLDADKFIPERWLKNCPNKYSTPDSFACIPFSFGPRMCPGKRLAEMQMYTLIAKIMQNYWLENKYRDFDIQYQLVLKIQNPLLYEFHDRR